MPDVEGRLGNKLASLRIRLEVNARLDVHQLAVLPAIASLNPESVHLLSYLQDLVSDDLVLASQLSESYDTLSARESRSTIN